MIDTNILIFASLSCGRTPYQAYVKAVTHPNHGVVCEQNIDELRRVYNILVTGDKDFLESGITSIKIVTAAEFLQME